MLMKNKLEETTVDKIKWIVRARWIVLAILVLLGVAAKLLGISPVPLSVMLFLALTVSSYNLYSFLYLRTQIQHRSRVINFLKYLQFVGDITAVTVLIYYTGGVESPFFILYVLNIVTANILLSSRETYGTAILCAILYSGLVLSENFHIILYSFEYSSRDLMQEQTIASTLFIAAAAAILGVSALLINQLSVRSKEAQTRLEDLERFNHTFIESVSSGAVVVDEKGRIIVFNKAAREITGFSSREMVGSSCPEHSGGETPLRELAYLLGEALKESKEISRNEVSIRAKNGQSIPIGFNISLLRGSTGRLAGAAAIFTDLRKVRALENRLRLKDRLSDLGRLASVIAHDLRNPLQIIRMFAQLIENNLTEPTQDERTELVQDIQSIVTQVDICEDRIKELLAFAKPMPMQNVSRAADVNINGFLDAFLEDCRQNNLYSHIELTKEFDSHVPHVLARGEQLRRIFTNLVGNAVEAMPDGGKLTVKTKFANKAVAIEVIDNGHGIPAEARKSIFEPFCTFKEGGTGLGLAIVQKLVLELDGAIEVESEEGKGAVFRVKLPAVRMKEKSLGK